MTVKLARAKWDEVGLGTRPDHLVAKELGVARSTVVRARQRRGIVAFDPTRANKQINWSAQPLGQVLDADLAERLGVSRQPSPAGATSWVFPHLGGKMHREAKAAIEPIRQANQYNCMTTSMVMCLKANGVAPEECTPALVNKVMGARAMQGAAWEDAIACAQHYGMKTVLMCPCSVVQLKKWTDRGFPVIIAWNPEDRPWAHASVVFDVSDAGVVFVADPNMPDPDEVVREMPKEVFYKKWAEKHNNGYLIRRTAMAVLPEITLDGRQMWASGQLQPSAQRVAARYQYK